MSMDDLIHTPKHKDLIYDVGLHRGEDTHFYLRKGFRVVAFEADPEHVTFCRKRFHQFIDEEQLKIVEGAITNSHMAGAGAETGPIFKNEQILVWGRNPRERAERKEKLGNRERSDGVK